MCTSNRSTQKHAHQSTPSGQNQPREQAKTQTQADSNSFKVPTFREEGPNAIDLASLTSADIEQLKTQDAFMYYSIPTVSATAVNGEEVDATALLSSLTSGRTTSCMVERKKRLSTECHPDVLIEELVKEYSGMDMKDLNVDIHQDVGESARDDDDDWLDFYVSMLDQSVSTWE